MDPDDAYIGAEVATARGFVPSQPMRWRYGEPVTVTYAGETYSGRITAVSPTSAQWSSTPNGVYYCGDQEWTPDLYPMLPDRWEPHDVPEWLIMPSSDSAHPDTSQPYFLDLIARIDELT